MNNHGKMLIKKIKKLNFVSQLCQKDIIFGIYISYVHFSAINCILLFYWCVIIVTSWVSHGKIFNLFGPVDTIGSTCSLYIVHWVYVLLRVSTHFSHRKQYTAYVLRNNIILMCSDAAWKLSSEKDQQYLYENIICSILLLIEKSS